MVGEKSFMVGLLPYAAMVTVEWLAVGLTILSKAAMANGMSSYVFVVYSNALGAVILFPCSLCINRKKISPLNFSILCKYFILSLVGITVMQNCLVIGVSYSSPTLAAALGNLVPTFTFLLAVIFRMEKLDLRSLRSQMKIMGTVVSISGALMVTLYRGPPVGTGLNEEPRPFPSSLTMLAPTDNWVIGGVFIMIASLSNAISNILQEAILKENPSEITFVSFYCFFGAVQSVVVSLLAERRSSAWILNADIEIISIVYAAIFGNLGICVLTSWCISKKGFVFVTMFKPLGISIAAFMGLIFLCDTLHVGSIVGTIIIIAGFSAVMWAQCEEEEENAKIDGEVSSLPLPSQKTPLLHSHMIM